MHLGILLAVLAIAWWSRHILGTQSSWDQCLTRFLFAPLLILSNAITLVNMGTDGAMLGRPLGIWSVVSFVIACAYLLYALLVLLHRACTAWQSLRAIQGLPQVDWQGESAYLLDVDQLIAARVGWWNPKLVISRGLLQSLSHSHLSAIRHHEYAHLHFQDTFWFFWLGWLRQITQWLPLTEALWQELLLLRELRADSWASRQTDALDLAEALYLMASDRSKWQYSWLTEYSASASDRLDRLAIRINRILEPTTDNPSSSILWHCSLAIFPLLMISLHSSL
jgi:Zn-dependent protease with chaperone function